jgi:hypothetical protein
MAAGGTSAGRTRSVPEEEPLTAEGSFGPNVLRAGDASAPASPGAGAFTSTSARPDRACRGDRSAPGRLLQEQGSWLRAQARRLWPRRPDPTLSPSDLVQGGHQKAARSMGRFPSRRCLRAWPPARVALALAISEAVAVFWIKALPVPLRDSPDPGDPL